MELIKARNAHQALPELLERIDFIGIAEDTRDGPVLRIPGPTTIQYSRPKERVVFWEERDINPFFHLFEALWLLAARRDVKFLAQFVKRMEQYSDDGKKFHAAYGYRWRKHFKKDQVNEVIENLKKNPKCRRQIISIWDPRVDLSANKKDIPCNLLVKFEVDHENKLNMEVMNRSNDAIMGALGTNCVQFSVLQEYVATAIGVAVGTYWQISSNMHVYLRDWEKYKGLTIQAKDPYRTSPRCPYQRGEVLTTPIVDCDIKTWEEDLQLWMKDQGKIGLRSNFFLRVATPMYFAHKAHKKGDTQGAIEIIKTQMEENHDWKIASLDWLERRRARTRSSENREISNKDPL